MRYGALLLLLCLAAGSCREAPPSGQVLARVDGLDITLRDFKTEMAAGDADAAALNEHAAVDRLIDRALLVAEARREGLDLSPLYLGDQRRDRDVLLVNALRAQIGSGPPPSAAAIADYISRVPQKFTDRRILVIDRLAAAGAAPALASMRGIGSATAVARRLATSGYRVERSTIVLDTADLAPSEVRALLATSPGNSLLYVAGDSLVSDSIVGQVRVPMPPEQMSREARGALIEQDKSARLEHLLAQLRSSARVERAGP